MHDILYNVVYNCISLLSSLRASIQQGTLRGGGGKENRDALDKLTMNTQSC
jgi:hypothetical protein